jgi:hypothetical protein
MRLAPHNNDRGVVAIEFVLVFPLLLIVVFAVVGLGAFLGATNRAVGAARDGARAASLGLSPPATVGDIDVTYAYSAGGPCVKGSDPGFTFDPNHKVTATAKIDNYPVSPVLPGLTPDVSESVVMVCSG